MKPSAFSYFAPKSVDEALHFLAADDQARPLAGGQSLVPMMNLRLARPSALIDLNRIAELAGITKHENGLLIGAMTRQAQLLRDPIVARHAPMVVEALAFVGHPSTRARGTIGGSLSNADPAAELPAVMLALDAELIVRGAGGGRRVTAERFFLGMFETAIEPGELLTAISIPLARDGDRSAFLEVSRRHGDFAIVSVAVNLCFSNDSTCTAARIVLGNIAPAPVRCRAAEEMLVGQTISDDVIGNCVDAVDAASVEMNSPGASRAYRFHLARVLMRRAVETARSRRGDAA
jgi:aerobic carbon-monoxide dehydrogenase medium subunit